MRLPLVALVALVAFAVFWPLVIQVCYGVRSLDPVVRDTTTVLQVRGPRKFFTVTLPSAAPFIATGLRVAVAVALIVELSWALMRNGGESGAFPGGSVSSVAAIGRSLFSDYAFQFEVTSVLILVAMVGAVVLARRERVTK